MTPNPSERDYSLIFMAIAMVLMATVFLQQVATFTSLLG